MIPDDTGPCPQHVRVADDLADLLAVLTTAMRSRVVDLVKAVGLWPVA